MKKKICILLFCLTGYHVVADPIILKADKAYTTGNLTSLGEIYSADPKNQVVSYLYAKAMLTKNIAKYAEDFVSNTSDNYMRNDLIHQLLIFYFNNDSYSSYLRVFKSLNPTTASLNEKCGYDYASNATNLSFKPLVNNVWLVNNNVPGWCAILTGIYYNNGKINAKERNLLLYNLIINYKTDIFNSVADEMHIKPINFYHYQNSKTSNLPNNNNYNYLVVQRINAIGHNDPYLAYSEMKQANINSNTEEFLGNYLAMQFAMKHDFEKAINLYSNYASDYMSDEEREWQTRSYMYYGKWSKVIECIENMPLSLKNKNVWLYWEGQAYANLGEKEKAVAFFKQIPDDYSYYAMLADAQLDDGTEFLNNPSLTTSLDNSQAGINAKIAFNLYREGKDSGSKNLINLASAQWNYASKQASDNELLAMSNLAASHSWYDLSIYAANQMDQRYVELSFPTPFLKDYIKYSQINGIDQSYPLAISRQESRFNYSSIAFDGGVGLMQIMPQTGAYIATKSGSKNCYRQSPECNIKFGSWYLGTLYDRFNGNLIYSTAAYNAGPGRVRKWQDKLGRLNNAVQIELIPIQITRDYVQKVLSNKAIYDAKLKDDYTIDLLAYIDKINKNRYINQFDNSVQQAHK
ncbi:MAG: lytic transglycosylase domain-containing protein [Burkholderiales bacterium]|nr:lytic transglycosylase domain-containing protein [Burkholderiales bacterium]